MLRKRYNKLSRIAMELALIILLPFLGAMLPYAVPVQQLLDIASLVVAVSCLFLFLLMSHAPAVIVDVAVQLAVEWLALLGFNLSFRLDGLSLLFAIVIRGIGLLIFISAHY